jgi:hypothetical protein
LYALQQFTSPDNVFSQNQVYGVEEYLSEADFLTLQAMIDTRTSLNKTLIQISEALAKLATR